MKAVPSMTKVHFELIARVINEWIEDYYGEDAIFHSEVEKIIRRFSYELRLTNPNFNVDKFRSACYGS